MRTLYLFQCVHCILASENDLNKMYKKRYIFLFASV